MGDDASIYIALFQSAIDGGGGGDGGDGGDSGDDIHGDGDILNATFDTSENFMTGQWYWYGNVETGLVGKIGQMSKNVSQFIKYVSTKNIPVLAILSEVSCDYCESFRKNILLKDDMKKWLATSGFMLIYLYNGEFGKSFIDPTRHGDDVYTGAMNYRFHGSILPIISISVKGELRGEWTGYRLTPKGVDGVIEEFKNAVPEFFDDDDDDDGDDKTINDIKLLSYARGETTTTLTDSDESISLISPYLLIENSSNSNLKAKYKALISGSYMNFNTFIGYVSPTSDDGRESTSAEIAPAEDDDGRESTSSEIAPAEDEVDFAGYVMTYGWPQVKKFYGSYLGSEVSGEMNAFERIKLYAERDRKMLMIIYGPAQSSSLALFETDWWDSRRNAGSSIGGETYSGYFRGDSAACNAAKAFLVSLGASASDDGIIGFWG